MTAVQTYGSDRVRVDGERITLTSRIDKGWTARTEKTHTSAEFPGTAVLWEDVYYEVVFAERLPQGVRYGLELWKESNAIRVSDRYDEESERARLEEHRKKLERERQRKSVNALALLTGHLPAAVQELLASELGVPATRLTLASVIGSAVVAGALILLVVKRVVAHEGMPLVLGFIAVYLGAESYVRLNIIWAQMRPIGSVAGWIIYAIFWAFTRKGPSPFAVPKGEAVVFNTEAPPDVALRDAITMREGFFTLLPAADQERIATRFDYDYRRESTTVAVIILFCSALGVAGSYANGARVSTLVAALLAAEQVYRIITFRTRPAGSILGFLVRPFVRKFL